MNTMVVHNPSEQGVTSQLIGVGTMVAGGAAAAMSYQRNHSLPWALGAWFVWPAALPYYLITKNQAAQANPRVSMAGGAVALLVGGSWYMWRKSQREMLVSLINNDPKIFAVRAFFATSKIQLPPAQAWLASPQGPEIRAAELITFTNATTALDAFNQIMSELPAIPAPVAEPEDETKPSPLSMLISQGVSAFEQKTGLTVPPAVQAEIGKYTATEQAQSAGTIVEQSQNLWNWMFHGGPEQANQNSSIQWQSYLGSIR